MSHVAVVTGGAYGIGLGIARQFVGDGHRVAIFDNNGSAADAVAGELRAEGADALPDEVDVPDHPSVEAAFERVRAVLGPIEILVTSAGIESFDPVLDITPRSRLPSNGCEPCWVPSRSSSPARASSLLTRFSTSPPKLIGVNGGMYI